MTPTETPDSTDRPDRRQTPADAPDPASNRPMSTDEIAAAYAGLADRIDRWECLDRGFTGRYRRRQFGGATGRVLDVACGTGTNFRFLPEDVDLVGVDISAEMLAKARERLDRLGRDGEVRRMDAQDLTFPDDSFDTVVSALSTCTFPDPVAALREMERVCRPDGRILLLEHGRSDVGLLARYQEWRDDAHYAEAGCRWTQEPLDVVSAAGIPVAESESRLFGVITLVEAAPSADD